MKLVSIWNPKGGQGKTLLALNLAAAAEQLGLKPLVIDQDQQGTAKHFYNGGNLSFEVVDTVPLQKPDVDIVIFDHQASDWELPKPKLIIMPLKPERSQFATYIDAKTKAEAAGKEIITVVTDGQSHRADEKNTVNILRKQGAFIIPSSGVFSRAATEYRTIFDERLNPAYKVKERRREISEILGRVLMAQNDKEEQGQELEHA